MITFAQRNNEVDMNIVQENNNANLAIQGTTATIMSSYAYNYYIEMLPWMAAAIPLILIDLKLGRAKAKSKGEKVTIGKSLKMTMDKVFSYLCWMLLSVTLSVAFDAPFVKYVIMACIYGLEVMSSMNSWFISKGLNISEAEMFRLVFKGIYHKVTGIEEDFNNVINKANETD